MAINPGRAACPVEQTIPPVLLTYNDTAVWRPLDHRWQVSQAMKNSMALPLLKADTFRIKVIDQLRRAAFTVLLVDNKVLFGRQLAREWIARDLRGQVSVSMDLTLRIPDLMYRSSRRGIQMDEGGSCFAVQMIICDIGFRSQMAGIGIEFTNCWTANPVDAAVGTPSFAKDSAGLNVSLYSY